MLGFVSGGSAGRPRAEDWSTGERALPWLFAGPGRHRGAWRLPRTGRAAYRDRMKSADRPRRSSIDTVIAVLVTLALAGLLQGCQFLQNEFFYLDRAAPAPAPDADAAGEHGLGGH